jgi:nucleotide-binding universal stress UspA family protein
MSAIEWKKICCPVDFSEPARAGLRVAADLCRRLGSELVLLYAEGGTKVAEELPPDGPVEGNLDSWRQEAQRLGAAQVTAVERAEGPPEVAVAEFASAEGVDLIVMGTHGRVDREHMLTGSVAEGVVRLAGCPVLTVRPTWKP